MAGLYERFFKHLLFGVDAERAHGLSIKALRGGLHPRFDAGFDHRLTVQIAGLTFPNPLGMAAGYDKGGDVPGPLLGMGFGHVEIGTVTPLPQPGNPRPRVFRLLADRSVINRLGFNSEGHAAVKARLQGRTATGGIVGINIGANKQSEDFAADYVKGIEAFGSIADYFTVNISSPNTPGLRGLQQGELLRDLLNRVGEAVDGLAVVKKPPVFLKIAPDLNESELDDIAGVLRSSTADALIVSNTTLARTGLKSNRFTEEAGGVSGRPLFERSTIVLAKMAQRLDGLERAIPLIGVGGVHNAETALQKIEAGASLVQLYTGLIFQGPSLPRRILQGMSTRLDAERAADLSSFRGCRMDEWASRSI